MSHAVKGAIAARRVAHGAPDKPADLAAHPDVRDAADRDVPLAQKPLDAVLRSACAHGRINLASRHPSLTSVPEEVFALLDDTAPAWYTQATGADAAPAPAPPPPWTSRSDLLVLLLSGNALEALDARIGAFARLQRLELHGNCLTSLPASLGDLAHLTALTLAHNRLTCIPESVLRLPNLASLDLSHNALETLWTPQQAADGVLPGLRHLDLRHNRLHTGAFVRANGGEVDVLALPKGLRRLHLGDNALQGPLPLQLVAPLTALEELDVSGNEVQDAVFAPPPPDANAPRALPRLLVLDVRRTSVAAPAALERLFASGALLSLDDARNKARAPARAPGTPTGVVPHQLVRVTAKPSAADAGLAPIAVLVGERREALPPLFLLLDAAPSSRRKRGGRGRGGESKRDDHDEPPQHDAGSALANAKLSTKKKEALGQVPCKFFRNNGCSAGDACPFAHTLPGEGQAKAVCQWYLKGSCRFGHRCALAHILPGQPMSMDRKNKRAAQHGQKADERAEKSTDKRAPGAGAGADLAAASARTHPVPSNEAGARARGTVLAPATPGAVYVPERARPLTAEGTSPPALERSAWDGTSTSLDAAFGTSPFSYPGTHSLFFHTNTEADVSARALGTTPSHAPWTRAPPADPLAESSHAEDFLPSSLSDLLTPAELERRMRSTREPPAPSAHHVSQSLPPGAPDFGRREMSPPAHGMGPFTRSGRLGAQGTPMPARVGAHSVHASPFLAGLGSPPPASPPRALGERVAPSFGARSDERRMAHAFASAAANPISPALLPARDDADDAIFELES